MAAENGVPAELLPEEIVSELHSLFTSIMEIQKRFNLMWVHVKIILDVISEQKEDSRKTRLRIAELEAELEKERLKYKPDYSVNDCLVESINERDVRIAELESENGELRAQVNDLKSSDEGHVRAREMDEAQINDLHALIKSHTDLIRAARQILMTCNLDSQRELWIDARKSWLNLFDNNFRGVG